MWRIAAIAGPALALDLVDGPVARRTGTESDFGARFDMEVDAATILVLAWAASRRTRWAWGIGWARYVFWLASRCRPAWRGPVGRSRFRRGVAGVQGAALWVAVLPRTPQRVAQRAVHAALVLLAASFGSQVVALERASSRSRRPSRVDSGVYLPRARDATPVPDDEQHRHRT